MTIEMLKNVFLWCSIINLGLFFLSFLIFWLARDWIYRFHGKWYRLSEDKFDATIYESMAFYKILILFFNIVPYVVLCIVD